jgi:hypothetical protein
MIIVLDSDLGSYLLTFKWAKYFDENFDKILNIYNYIHLYYWILTILLLILTFILWLLYYYIKKW